MGTNFFALTCNHCGTRMRVNASREQARKMKIFCNSCRKLIQQQITQWYLSWDYDGASGTQLLLADEIYLGRSRGSGPAHAAFIELHDPRKYWSRLHFSLLKIKEGWTIRNHSALGTGLEIQGTTKLLKGEESAIISDSAKITTQNRLSLSLSKIK